MRRTASTGMTVIESASELRRTITTVRANGINILPSIPWSASKGTKVSAIINSPKRLGRRTSSTARSTRGSRSDTASNEACSLESSLKCRSIFSTCTIAASTIIPREMASPPKDIRLAESPTCCMIKNVVSVASGKVRATTSAPRRFLRNR